MFSTKDSYPIQEIFRKEMSSCRRMVTAKKFRDAFCVAMAVFMNMKDYDFWFSDTEDGKRVENIFNTFYKLWMDLFKVPDETLGLKGRDVLTQVLQVFGNQAKDSFCYKFKWFAAE